MSGRLIVLDETGVNVAMSPLWARAPIGERAVCKRPANTGGNVSVVGALAAEGIIAYHALYGAMDTERFEDFIVRKLAPKLGARDIVFMDNVEFHKADCIRAAIEKTGAKVVFLPPYSPEMNPIEEGWWFFKDLMRKAAARDVPNLRRSCPSDAGNHERSRESVHPARRPSSILMIGAVGGPSRADPWGAVGSAADNSDIRRECSLGVRRARSASVRPCDGT